MQSQSKRARYGWNLASALRRFSQVEIRPGADGVELELEGAIVAMVEVALGSDAGAANSKTALRRPLLNDGSRRSVKVVAGT